VPVYYDHLHLVYLKIDPTTRELAERLAVDWQQPGSARIERPLQVAPPDWLAGRWPRAADSHVDERLGSLFAGVGSYDRALEHFEAAYRRTPRDPRVRLLLGLFREARGDDADAERLLRGVSSASLEQVDVRLLAGQLCLWGSRPRHAMAHFERAIALGAPEPDTAIRLARAAILAGELERAESLLATIARDHPASPEPWNLRAVIATRRQQPGEAIRAFEASLGIEPRQLGVYRALAGLYRQVGQPERARETLERARAFEASP